MYSLNFLYAISFFSKYSKTVGTHNVQELRHNCESSPRGLTFTWWGCCCLCLLHKPAELAHSFVFCSCVYFCLYGPFNCISFHTFSRQLSAFSLCFSGLISAFLVLSTIYLFIKVFFSPDKSLMADWLETPINELTTPFGI